MILIATLGFDERPVLHALSEAGFGNVDKIILIRPANDDPRAVKAVSEIKKIAVISGLRDEDVISYRVEVSDFWGSVRMIHELFLDHARNNNEIILCLGGGLRALVLETFTAFILLTPKLRSVFRVRIDLETGAGSIIISGAEIFTNTSLSRNELEVLRIILEEPGITLSRISDRIVKPASSIHRILKKLLDRGFVRREGNKYYLSPAGRAVLEIVGREDLI
ncbi:CRISPR-associated HTH regulatory protein, Csa3 family [Staphylothermus marinus F1]|uniref:CRISPR-associated HTH regulatory protein, Csa3 family n=1 Tax=Staphylothermus marinus (strain ATCC 43588 / DSM 3639 / JCM 9404 / F1) TaxID=399550 RepID=A3DLC2_STAMF|nr:CRISPR-associated CARF protein Csa3 [Staphylothermus marinus]ABN69432.1 CRISPR-associated HTH regulatory protein, Csa3 family [Staphylothermus marinus F1]